MNASRVATRTRPPTVVSSPGRPTSRDVLERDTVLDAALGLLLEHGPSRMRLADLARQLGVVPSALHYHFPGGKDEVIGVIFDREEARVLERMTAAASQPGDSRSRLGALARARLKNASRLARLHRVDFPASGRTGDRGPAAEIQEYVLQRRQGFLDCERDLISQILRSALRVRAKDHRVDVAAAAFQGALFNVTRTFALTPTAKAEAVLDELVDVFVLGFERRAAADPTALAK
jgi:AcrR family transcriptional regulator